MGWRFGGQAGQMEMQFPADAVAEDARAWRLHRIGHQRMMARVHGGDATGFHAAPQCEICRVYSALCGDGPGVLAARNCKCRRIVGHSEAMML